MSQYTVFEGRSSRSEFWWYFLALLIAAFFFGVVLLFLSFIPYALSIGVSGFILAILTPTLAVTIRRLHDTGRSAWWSLCYAPSGIGDVAVLLGVPVSGTVILSVGIIGRILLVLLIIFLALPSDTGSNKYGADPR